MNLMYYPSIWLDQQMTPVDLENPQIDLVDLKQQMTDCMLSNNGIGLAANQIAVDANVFVMGSDPKNVSMCINPMVLDYTDDTQNSQEGCLSFPGIFVKIKRPKHILVQYWDEHLCEQVTELEDYTAKIYLHEMDHLLGITMKDRVSKLKWNMAIKRAQKVQKSNA